MHEASDSLVLREKGASAGPHTAGRANLFDGTRPFPVAVLREDAVNFNINLMSRYCASRSVSLAPHAKTTMCAEVINRQLAAGAWAITVATAWQLSVVAAMGVERAILANEIVDVGSIRLLVDVLAANPGLQLYCYVDSAEGYLMLASHLPAVRHQQVRVLVELGVHRGRTGLRDDNDAVALAREVSSGPFALGGVAAFEGIIDRGDLAQTLASVDELLGRLENLVTLAVAERLFGPSEPIVTVGGSAYFDRVVEKLSSPVAALNARLVLRSGCYVAHDCGTYRAVSPLDGRSTDPEILRPALEVWAPILSRPEPTLAVAGLGRRDVSADAGLPVAQWVRSGAQAVRPADPIWRAIAINDQHLIFEVPERASLAVGDLVGFGISHPCTTFDKWRQLSLVDGAYNITGTASTHF